MKNLGATQKKYRKNDPVTKIGYKIIHVVWKGYYEIWTQYTDKYGKFRKNKVMYEEAIRRERDLEGLIDYVDNYLIKNHIRFYEGKDFELDIEYPDNLAVELPEKRQPIENKAQEKRVSHTWTDALTKETKQYKAHSNTDLSPIFPVNINSPKVHTSIASGSKSEQLEQLFCEWQEEQKREPDDVWKLTNGGNANISKGHFRRDGIIDELTFERERVKVLFISAEANDNGYSALTNATPSSIDDYREYYSTGIETYKGRMRERLSELYKAISRTERNSMSNPEAAIHFAVMDLNKRGGGALIGDGSHIDAYCRYYQNFIRRELEIISPDVVAFIGTNIYDMDLHTRYFGAKNEAGKCYFVIGGEKVPILRLWQTSYTYGKGKIPPGYEDNIVIGSQVAKCLREMERVEI